MIYAPSIKTSEYILDSFCYIIRYFQLPNDIIPRDLDWCFMHCLNNILIVRAPWKHNRHFYIKITGRFTRGDDNIKNVPHYFVTKSGRNQEEITQLVGEMGRNLLTCRITKWRCMDISAEQMADSSLGQKKTNFVSGIRTTIYFGT